MSGCSYILAQNNIHTVIVSIRCEYETALVCLLITIYAPVIYTRPCIMFWRRGYTLRGEVGGGWALEFPSFLGPVKWHRADRRVPFSLLFTLQRTNPLTL
jgi:hypothetical protein